MAPVQHFERIPPGAEHGSHPMLQTHERCEEGDGGQGHPEKLAPVSSMIYRPSKIQSFQSKNSFSFSQTIKTSE